MPKILKFNNRWVRDLVQNIGSTLDGADPIVFLSDDTENFMTWNVTGRDYQKMLSALLTGLDLMWPDEKHRLLAKYLELAHLPQALSEEEGCIDFPLTSTFIEFHPMNPFDDNAEYPVGYLAPPFQVNSEINTPLVGYDDSDIIVTYDAVPLGLVPIWDLPALLANGLPQIRISVSGSGQIELDLLATPLGGMAIITIDQQPNVLDILLGVVTPAEIIDLGVDIAIPPETDIVSAQEINIEKEAGVKTIVYITFLPVLDDSLTPPVRFGGGIRAIQLCGFESEALIMSAGDIRLSPTNDCIIQQQQIDGTWIDVADLSDCNPPSGGGGGAVQAKITNYRLELPAFVENNTGDWLEIAGTEITHSLEYPNYTIIAGAQMGGVNSTIARYRVITDGIFRGNANEYHEWDAGTTGSQHATWATNLSGAAPPVDVDIALQFIDVTGTARIFANTSIHYTVIETVEPISQATIDDILGAIANLETSVAIHTTQISNMSANITAIISQINAINAQIASYQSQISANDADILALQISQTLQDTTISNINDDIQALQINDALQDASIAQLVADLEECCPEEPTPQQHFVDFSETSDPYTLTANQDAEVVANGGNPDDNLLLITGGLEFMEVEIDLGASKFITSINFDVLQSALTGHEWKLFIDDIEVYASSGTVVDEFETLTSSDQVTYPQSGQIIRIWNTAISAMLLRLDNILIQWFEE